MMAQKIEIRISGDGRMSSSRTHFVIITLTVLIPNSVNDCHSNYFMAEECYSVAVMEGNENREDASFFLFYLFFLTFCHSLKYFFQR